MFTKRLITLFILSFSFGNAYAAESEFELRAGYGFLSTQSGSIAPGGLINGESVTGFVLTGLVTSPFSWVDFGLQFEQLSNGSGSANLQTTFQRLGFVFEKEFRYKALFFAPVLTLSFLNLAHYSNLAGQQLFRGNATLTWSLGGTIGARWSFFGLALEMGYRQIAFTRMIDASTNQDMDVSTIGGLPNWSGLYGNLSATAWF